MDVLDEQGRYVLCCCLRCGLKLAVQAEQGHQDTHDFQEAFREEVRVRRVYLESQLNRST